MPRVVPGPARYRYGGHISPEEYKELMTALDSVGREAGISEEENVPIAELAGRVAKALADAADDAAEAEVDDGEKQYDLGYEAGYERGKADAENAAEEAMKDLTAFDVKAAMKLVEEQGLGQKAEPVLSKSVQRRLKAQTGPPAS